MIDDGLIAERLARIAAKIRQREVDLGPCLTSADLREFEEQYAILIPAGYREFLLEIGNGASGPPEYGLVPLAEPPPGHGDSQSHTHDTLLNIRKAFPFTKAWIWENGDESDEGTEDHLGDGQLYLGTDGCGMDWHLIVTGPERGNVWWFSGEGITPTAQSEIFFDGSKIGWTA